MTRGLALPLFLGLALAQVGLLSGPRPPSEVRGTLEGDARQGYRVRVEFLVEVGGNPTQGTTYQSLGWNGQLYLCAPDCGTFRLSGYTPGGTYTQAAFDLLDAQNRLRGRAGVNTLLDAQGRPQYHQVDYAVWPLSGTRTWQASPDNPVPLERGGWLTARPPGGSPERYRYPGMEGYEPPSGGTILAGLSPQDRDLAQKTLIDSLATLRQFYRRQAPGSEIWFFVPEVSPWTLTLAQEFWSPGGRTGALRGAGGHRPGLLLHVLPQRRALPRPAQALPGQGNRPGGHLAAPRGQPAGSGHGGTLPGGPARRGPMDPTASTSAPEPGAHGPRTCLKLGHASTDAISQSNLQGPGGVQGKDPGPAHPDMALGGV